MADQFAKQIKSHMSQLIWLLTILIALSGLTVTIIIGHREWDKQTELTQAFESCMQIAPFKNSFQANSYSGAFAGTWITVRTVSK